ncbi:MAG: DNA-3-methyladenine glycosylase 2 family protein [Lachnospiraceae bacterium]|nr:DNA-3-methyladenine glycosylase 2 family protein [Lachnospiraceae bacterium]
MVIRKLENFDLDSIAESGQCFRMNRDKDGTYKIVAYGKVLSARDLGEGEFSFDCEEGEFNEVWKDYFDLEENYKKYIDSIPDTDEFLMKAAEVGGGIRILRQEPFETLISFIISQRKSIPAIKKSVESLCSLCGEPLEGGFYAFPRAEDLIGLSIDELNSCSLGYRSQYVHSAAQMVGGGEIDLERIGEMNDEDLLMELKSIKGVGTKVANCVMLFAYHRIGSFPIDVWIKRVIDEIYEGEFPLERYEGFAGVIQQYMFYYGRNFMKKW